MSLKTKVKTKLRKGDTVKVTAGKFRGKVGSIVDMDLIKERVYVEGLTVKKTKKKQHENDSSEIVDVEAPIHISNVMYIDKSGEVTRLTYAFNDGVKQRVAKKSKEVIDG